MQNLSSLLTATTTAVPVVGNQLFELLYDELRSIARAHLHRKDDIGLLNTTTLVHESYLRFLKSGQLSLQDRRHFLAYASHVMRSIVVDLARQHLAGKRGSGQSNLTLNTDVASNLTASDEHIVKLHEALDELAAFEPRLGQVVEMRYFGGLREEEVAEALDVSVRTVQRDWEKARMLLSVALRD
jgi:RNA polymerase sigma factor (TIGR02999 family)